MSETTQKAACGRVPIREGLLRGDLAAPGTVTLQGTKCTSCGEATLGHQQICPNCGRDTVSAVALGRQGTLWAYTIARNRPPGAYKGPDPFVPFGLGLVELPDGLRVYAPLEGDIGKLKVGMPLTFKAYVTHTDAEGREVVGFTFKLAE